MNTSNNDIDVETETGSDEIDETTKLHTIPEKPVMASIIDDHSEPLSAFDPAIHAVNDDGTPKRKANGDYALRRGRKSGAQIPAKVSVAQIVADPADVAAVQTCNVIINGCVMTMGREWEASDDEAGAMRLAFRDYYRVKGVPNLPPEIGLAIVLFGYAAPRLNTEKTRGKIALAWDWLKLKVMK